MHQTPQAQNSGKSPRISRRFTKNLEVNGHHPDSCVAVNGKQGDKEKRWANLQREANSLSI
jgi:hypothetical protein